MRQAAASQVQHLEHLVETSGVTGTLGADREDLVQVLAATEDVAVDEGLASAHPVLVARDGVDLTVVSDPAERVRQRPRRERVGGEARVDQAQCALDTIVLQVEVETLELRGGEHALVDERLAGQAGEVHGLATRATLAGAFGAEFVLGALTHHVCTTLEIHAGVLVTLGADEDLTERRHRVARQCAQRGVVGSDLAPAENLQALFDDDLLDCSSSLVCIGIALREECDTGCVRAFGGQREVHDSSEELVGNLQQNARTVTRVGF